MPRVSITAVHRLTGVACVAVLALTGCASKQTETAPAPLGPASAAVAPAPNAPPAGEVRKLDGQPVAAVADPGPGGLAVLTGSGPAAGAGFWASDAAPPKRARPLRMPAVSRWEKRMERSGVVCQGLRAGRAVAGRRPMPGP